MMDNDEFADLSVWITEAGLAGRSESAVLGGFVSEKLRAA